MLGSGHAGTERVVARAAPGLCLAASVFAAAIPWGLPAAAAFILPFVTLSLVFVFSSAPTPTLPAWSVFAAGLATDLLTQGPLGFWASLFLLAHAVAGAAAARQQGRLRLGAWLSFAAMAAAVAALGWAVASVYFMRLLDWQPLVLAAAAAIVLFPVLARFDALRRGREPWRRSGA